MYVRSCVCAVIEGIGLRYVVRSHYTSVTGKVKAPDTETIMGQYATTLGSIITQAYTHGNSGDMLIVRTQSNGRIRQMSLPHELSN